MRLQKLIAKFSTRTELPIEIPEVREEIIAMGIQDKIVFCPDAEMDKTKLKGAYMQFRVRPTMYGEYEDWSLIVFCANEGIPWQRMICAKEMIHILDDEAERTSTLDQLDGLLNRLLGSVSTEEFNIFDIMAAKDRLALYQAIPLLFPMAARDNAIQAVKSGRKTLHEIADDACLPVELVSLALTDNWPGLVKDLTC